MAPRGAPREPPTDKPLFFSLAVTLDPMMASRFHATSEDDTRTAAFIRSRSRPAGGARARWQPKERGFGTS